MHNAIQNISKIMNCDSSTASAILQDLKQDKEVRKEILEEEIKPCPIILMDLVLGWSSKEVRAKDTGQIIGTSEEFKVLSKLRLSKFHKDGRPPNREHLKYQRVYFQIDSAKYNKMFDDINYQVTPISEQEVIEKLSLKRDVNTSSTGYQRDTSQQQTFGQNTQNSSQKTQTGKANDFASRASKVK